MPKWTRMRQRVAGGLAVMALGATLVACGDDDSEQASEASAPSSTPQQDDGTDTTGTGAGCAVDLGIPGLGASSVGTGPGSTIDAMTSGYGSVAIEGGPLIPYDREASDDPAVGCPAPALTGVSYEGEPTSFSPGEDGPTLLVFLAHWCPHCNREVPMMLEWDESGSAPENLNIIGVSTGVTDARPNFPPGQWIDEVNWPWPVIADTEPPEGVDTLLGDAGIVYGATSFPFATLVDRTGTVVARHAGELTPDELTEFVNQLE